MSGVPILQEEVNRKALETVAYLTMALHHGKITPEQFSTGIDTLFMALSGLVTDKDFILMISEAQHIIDKEKSHGRTLKQHDPSESRASPGSW